MSAPREHRLSAEELAAFLVGRPPRVRALVLEMRDLVRRCAPESVEAVRFACLCYFLPDQPFGSIGGNVCLIEIHGREVRLSFLHGSSLPDPGRLLAGTAKAKRFVVIRSKTDPPRKGLEALVRGASRRSRT
jgi:hypothetical protein